MCKKLKVMAALAMAVSMTGIGGGVPAHNAPASEQETAVPPSRVAGDKGELTATNFEKLHRLIRPQPGEWKWAEIPWMPSVWDARKKAAEQGKPIFIFSMAGEPMGVC